MSLLGNIFLTLALLFYVGLFALNSSRPNLSGEGGMGYGLGLAFLGLGFAVCSLVVTVALAYKNGFGWVSPDSAVRNLLVGLGWLSAVATIFFSAAFSWETVGMPPIMRLFAGHGAVWMPFLFFIPAVVLLNDGLRQIVSPLAYKGPLVLLFSISIVASLGMLWGWLVQSSQDQAAALEQNKKETSERHDQFLQDIAKCNPDSEIINILVFTGRFHDEDVKTAAVARIKTNPKWEQELLRLLDSEGYKEVYTFIDGNAVDHPDLFPEPLNRSMLKMAEDIRSDIRDANNLQDWHFEHLGIERLLRALDQFEGRGVDFRPAVQAVRAALDETPPSHIKKVRFNVQGVLDRWISAHK